MSMRMAPPGLASASQTGFVKPCGPHHRASWAGSVHALKTRSRGASKVRVRTSFRSVGAVAAPVLPFFASDAAMGFPPVGFGSSVLLPVPRMGEIVALRLPTRQCLQERGEAVVGLGRPVLHPRLD